MSPTESAVLVGFFAFLGVIVTPIITSFINRQHELNKERHDYIKDIVSALIELRAELQYYQLPEWNLKFGEAPFSDLAISEEFQKMQLSFGKAYAIMISVDIKEIRDKAPDIMDENPSESPSKKLKAIDFALERLGREYRFFDGNNSDRFR